MSKRWLGGRALCLALLFTVLIGGCQPDEDEESTGDTGQPLALVTRTFHVGFSGADAYWQEGIVPTGGVTPYSYYIELGTLPPGLAMAGEPTFVSIEGEPVLAGHYEFVLEVTDAVDSTVSAGYAIDIFDADAVDLSGQWQYTMAVTHASGFCADEVGVSRTHLLTVMQEEDGATIELTFSGFFDMATSQITGTLRFSLPHVLLSGSYPEGGGTTTGSHSLELCGLDTLRGRETWSWTDGVETCTDGLADVEAIRVP